MRILGTLWGNRNPAIRCGACGINQNWIQFWKLDTGQLAKSIKGTMKNIYMITASRLCLFAATSLVSLLAAAANPDCPAYDRNAWKHWVDEDRDCQNARWFWTSIQNPERENGWVSYSWWFAKISLHHEGHVTSRERRSSALERNCNSIP